MNNRSDTYSDVDIITSIVIPEFNNASVSSNQETPLSGLFVTPSIVFGRASDITGYCLVASNELGKLEYADIGTLISLNDLSNVIITAPVNGQLLAFDGSADWINQTVELNNLSDVLFTNLLVGEALRYDGTNWINSTFELSLGDLTDVTLTSPVNGQVLFYDGAEWVNQSVNISLDDLSDVVITGPTLNQVLTYDGANWVNQNLFISDLLDVFEIGLPTGDYFVFTAGTIWLNDIPKVTLEELTNVTITGPTVNQVLTYNGSIWVNQDVTISLDQFTDVVLTSPSSGDVLRFDGTNWINSDYFTTLTLGGLNDVVLTLPSTNQIIQYDGSDWVNVFLNLNGLSDVVLTAPTSNQVLQYDGADWVNVSFKTSAGNNGDIQLSDGSNNFITATTHDLNYSETGVNSEISVGIENGEFDIEGVNATTVATVGCNISINGGDGATTGNGGNVVIESGSGGATGAGGDINIMGEDGTGSGNGGDITFSSNGKINIQGPVVETIEGNPELVGTTPNVAGDSKGIYVKDGYAYITNVADTFTIYDIKDPTSPTEIGSVTDAVNLIDPFQIKVVGNYAYVAKDNVGDGIAIVDISDPTNPTVSGSINGLMNNVLSLEIFGSFLFAGALLDNSIYTVDISDPSNPVIVANFIDAINLNGVITMKIKGNILYIGALLGDRVSAIDISDPLNLSLISSLLDATNLIDVIMIDIQGNFLYAAARGTPNRVSVVDISDPSSMTIVDTLANANFNTTEFCLIAAGDYLYQGGVNANINIIDITDPTSITLLYTLATSPTSGSVGMIQGNYLYTSGNNFNVYDIHANKLNSISTSTILTNTVSTNNFNADQMITNSAVSVYGELSVKGIPGIVLPLVGERNATAAATTAIALGNGGSNVLQGMTMPFPCKVFAISMKCSSTSTCTLNVYLNGVDTTQGVSVTSSSAAVSSIVDVDVNPGDYLGMTITAGSAVNGMIGTIYIKLIA